MSDHLSEPLPGKPRQILWRIYSKRALLCAGAIERPIAFANIDRPGVMLAGALRSFANRWAVVPGQQVGLGVAGAAQAEVPQAEDGPVNITPFWHLTGEGRAGLDVQNDVTVKDIMLAKQENFVSVEHLKRYNTLGMTTDQGKTSNVTGLAVMAELTGARDRCRGVP